jgi:hypothetical protein
MQVSSQLHSQAALPPGKGLPVPIGQEAGWTPELVWILWSREKSRALRESNSGIQLITHRYTAWDISTPKETYYI